jgi:hypothetical protein
MIQNDIFTLEDFVHGNPVERSLIYNDINISNDLVEKSFNDHLKLVNIEFKTPDYFYNNAYFWFRIYSQYTTSQVVLHDKNHLNLVYTVLDYSDLKKTIDSPYTASNLQTFLTGKKTIEYKETGTQEDYERVEKSIQSLSCLTSSIVLNDESKKILGNLDMFLQEQMVIYEEKKCISKKIRLVCKNMIYELNK